MDDDQLEHECRRIRLVAAIRAHLEVMQVIAPGSPSMLFLEIPSAELAASLRADLTRDEQARVSMKWPGKASA